MQDLQMVIPTGLILDSRYLCHFWRASFEPLHDFVNRQPSKPDDIAMNQLITHLSGLGPRNYPQVVDKQGAIPIVTRKRQRQRQRQRRRRLLQSQDQDHEQDQEVKDGKDEQEELNESGENVQSNEQRSGGRRHLLRSSIQHHTSTPSSQVAQQSFHRGHKQLRRDNNRDMSTDVKGVDTAGVGDRGDVGGGAAAAAASVGKEAVTVGQGGGGGGRGWGGSVESDRNIPNNFDATTFDKEQRQQQQQQQRRRRLGMSGAAVWPVWRGDGALWLGYFFGGLPPPSPGYCNEVILLTTKMIIYLCISTATGYFTVQLYCFVPTM
jgi:hypothetical protein